MLVIAKMGQFSTYDFVGTRTRFQRFSDSKLFHGWIENFTLGNIVVRASTESLISRGDRFIFHVGGKNANARFIADFNSIEGLELFRSTSIPLADSGEANVIDVPEANFAFRISSQLEYQPPTEEVRHMVGGWIVTVKNSRNEDAAAFLADVSEHGAGILSSTTFQRGEQVSISIDAQMRQLVLDAEIRYCVKSKIAPDMYKSGLKLNDFGRLEGAVWRNFLKSA